MAASLESLVHEAYVAHFGGVADSFRQADKAITTAYDTAATEHTEIPIEHGTLQFYYTSDGYINRDGNVIVVNSAMQDSTGLIDGMPQPSTDSQEPSQPIKKAYERLARIASSDSAAARTLQEILEQTCPEEIDDGPIAVRRPLHVFRVTPGYSEPDRRTAYAGDIVALPEIVNPSITQRIGKQVVTAQTIINSLAGNAEVAKALSDFRAQKHQLSRGRDTRDPFWAPLRTYKEGIVTAAQAVSFLSEGITDEATFSEAVQQWRQDKSFETIASSIRGAILGPLATHGVQPKGELVRTPEGAMRQDLKTTMLTISSQRKRKMFESSIRGLSHAGIDAATLSRMTPRERAERLIDKDTYFLPGWGCLAPASTIRRVTNLALATVIEPESI